MLQMAKSLLIVDIETDSNHPHHARILEIAVARLNLGTGQVELRMDTFVRPDCAEDKWSGCWFMENSGVPAELIRQAPAFDSVRPRFETEMQHPITAYNTEFDFTVLARHGVDIPEPWPWLMLACTPILRLPGSYGDYKWPKFSEAWRHFFPRERLADAHRAGPDAVNEAKLAFALYKGGYLKAPKRG